MDQYKFGQLLKFLRKKHHYTQQDIALLFNKTEAAVRMWELGKNQPDFNTLIKLTDLYHVSLDFIAGREKGVPFFSSLDNYSKFFQTFIFMLPSPAEVVENIDIYGNSINGIIQLDPFFYKDYKKVFLCSASGVSANPLVQNGDHLLISVDETPPNSIVILGTPSISAKKRMTMDIHLAHYQFINNEPVYTTLGTNEPIAVNEYSRPLGEVIKIIHSC